MELKDFVSQSIQQIVAGVREAQQQHGTDARINPSNLRLGSETSQKHLFDFDNHMLLSNVEFDVAVTAEEGKGTKGGIGVFVGSVGLGSQGQSETRNSSINQSVEVQRANLLAQRKLNGEPGVAPYSQPAAGCSRENANVRQRKKS